MYYAHSHLSHSIRFLTSLVAGAEQCVCVPELAMSQMSQIKDEIRRDVPSRPHVARSQSDVQRLKLEKLMKNPEKAVLIPEKPKGRGPPVVPDFVRNVMGSSAGAGSGEFHVYRHLRRKEYARQHYMQRRAEWESLEADYHQKIEDNKRKAEEETAKKRAKRLKKKQKLKLSRKRGKRKSESESEEDSTDSDDNAGLQAAKAGTADTDEKTSAEIVGNNIIE